MIPWSGTILQLIGAAIVASNWLHPYWGYAAMLPGALIWLGVAAHRRDGAQMMLQATFVLLNFVGLARWAA